MKTSVPWDIESLALALSNTRDSTSHRTLVFILYPLHILHLDIIFSTFLPLNIIFYVYQQYTISTLKPLIKLYSVFNCIYRNLIIFILYGKPFWEAVLRIEIYLKYSQATMKYNNLDLLVLLLGNSLKKCDIL